MPLFQASVEGKAKAQPRLQLRTGKTRWRVRAYTARLALVCGPVLGGQAMAQTPAVGAKAPDFTLSTPVGKPVSLASETGRGDLVLVVLRGFPGYQCPYCQKQVHDITDHAQEFAAKGAQVLLVYPGPPAELDAHAKEFLARQASLPPNVTLVVDPDYKMTNLYGLRWEGEHETAYPSTFILDKAGKVQYEKISHSHGDRTTAEEILNHL